MSDQQKAHFQKRLARIAAGADNTFATVYVGPQDMDTTRGKRGRAAAQAVARAPRALGRRILTMFQPVIALSAFTAAAASVLIVRLVRFRYFEMGAQVDPRIDMAIDAGAGIVVLLLLHSLFSLRTRANLWAKTGGLVAGLLLMHNAVHLAPDAFNRLFSPEWVNTVLTTTQPGSIMVAGAYYAL